MSEEPDPEVPARAKRSRQYSARYKLAVLAEYEQLDKAGLPHRRRRTSACLRTSLTRTLTCTTVPCA